MPVSKWTAPFRGARPLAALDATAWNRAVPYWAGRIAALTALLMLTGVGAAPAVRAEPVTIGTASSKPEVEINLGVLDQLDRPGPGSADAQAPVLKPPPHHTTKQRPKHPAARKQQHPAKTAVKPTAKKPSLAAKPPAVAKPAAAAKPTSTPPAAAAKAAPAPTAKHAPRAAIAVAPLAPSAAASAPTAVVAGGKLGIGRQEIAVPSEPTGPAPIQEPAQASEPPPSRDAESGLSTPPAKTPAAAPTAAKLAALTPGSLQLSIPFAGGEGALPTTAKPDLDALARRLANDRTRLQINAYASSDGNGGASGARRLALARALEVRTFLIDHGIDSARMDVSSLGNANDGKSSDRVDVLVSQR